MGRGVCKSGLRPGCGDAFVVRRVGRPEECSLGEYIAFALHCIASPDRIVEWSEVKGGRGKTSNDATLCHAHVLRQPRHAMDLNGLPHQRSSPSFFLLPAFPITIVTFFLFLFTSCPQQPCTIDTQQCEFCSLLSIHPDIYLCNH